MSRRFIISQIFILACAVLALVLNLGKLQKPALPVYGQVGEFSLLDHKGNAFGLNELEGKVWVADFIFTTCSGICPTMSKAMSGLNQAFSRNPQVRMVSITVNPENDTPEVMELYAKKYKAQGEGWIFLTGERDAIQKLALESFKMGDMKEIVFHSALFALVDEEGRIRGYYDGTDPQRVAQLHKDLPRLLKKKSPPVLPTINATLNALAGVFLLLGFLAIRRKDHLAHRKAMIAAFVCSALFLCTYLYYHMTTHAITRYAGEGWLKGLYFFVLGTHTPLAAVIVPFILIALWHAFSGDFKKHTAITRWLLPVWGYVSVTGVVIYLMLYIF